MIEIPVPEEGFTLEGRLDGPAGGAGAVVCHPHPAFGGNLHVPLVADLAAGLAAAGFRVLRFNFRGVDGSGGRATGGKVEERDVFAACAFLRRELRQGGAGEAGAGEGGLVLAGYSFGALMGLKAIARGLRPAAFAAVAVPTGLFADDTAREVEVRGALAAVPTVLVAGDRDPLCDARSLARLADGTEARLAIVDGADHVPTAALRPRFVEAVVDFARRRGDWPPGHPGAKG